MEQLTTGAVQLTSGAVSDLLSRLGIFGALLAVIVAVGYWYLKASRDLRSEKEGVIKRQNESNATLAEERDKYKEAYFSCKYPGSAPDPFEDNNDNAEEGM